MRNSNSMYSDHLKDLKAQLDAARARKQSGQTLTRWASCLGCDVSDLRLVPLELTRSIVAKMAHFIGSDHPGRLGGVRIETTSVAQVKDIVESRVLSLGRSGRLWVFDDDAEAAGAVDVPTDVAYYKWTQLLSLDQDDLIVVDPLTHHGVAVEWLSDLLNYDDGQPIYKITEW